VKLGLPDGRLTVRSRPTGASVTIGGAYRGRTPLELDVRPDLQQAVSVTREGYEPATRELSVAAGESAVVDVELKPILGEVIVRGTRRTPQLLVDGEAKGAANQTLQLPATRPHARDPQARLRAVPDHGDPRPGLAQSVEATAARRRGALVVRGFGAVIHGRRRGSGRRSGFPANSLRLPPPFVRSRAWT